jgi:hypothetical protein
MLLEVLLNVAKQNEMAIRRASTGPKDNEAGRQAVALCPLTRQQRKEQNNNATAIPNPTA